MRTFLKKAQFALAGLGLLILVGHASARAAVPVENFGQRESADANPVAGRSVWDGVYSAEQAKNGAVLYKSQCASCHQENLGGSDCAPPLVGRYFMDRWVTVGDVFQLTLKTMPQEKPGSLTPQEYADIISFVLSANKMPSGQTKLPPDINNLRTIKVEAKTAQH